MCQLHFSHVLHFEHFETEWKQFLKEVDLEEELQLPWENKGLGRSSLASYYNHITPDQTFKLYKIYQADFQMFDYNIDDEL